MAAADRYWWMELGRVGGRSAAEVAGGAVADLGLLISGPRITHNSQAYPRARARMARPWSARCYRVARHREGSRQNSIGPRITHNSHAYPRATARMARPWAARRSRRARHREASRPSGIAAPPGFLAGRP